MRAGFPPSPPYRVLLSSSPSISSLSRTTNLFPKQTFATSKGSAAGEIYHRSGLKQRCPPPGRPAVVSLRRGVLRTGDGNAAWNVNAAGQRGGQPSVRPEHHGYAMDSGAGGRTCIGAPTRRPRLVLVFAIGSRSEGGPSLWRLWLERLGKY